MGGLGGFANTLSCRWAPSCSLHWAGEGATSAGRAAGPYAGLCWHGQFFACVIQEQTHQRTQFVLYEFRLLVCQDNVISRSLKGFLRNPDILSDTNIISRIIMRYHKAEQSQDLLSVRALKLQLPYLSFVMWGRTLWCHPSCHWTPFLGATGCSLPRKQD